MHIKLVHLNSDHCPIDRAASEKIKNYHYSTLLGYNALFIMCVLVASIYIVHFN